MFDQHFLQSQTRVFPIFIAEELIESQKWSTYKAMSLLIKWNYVIAFKLALYWAKSRLIKTRSMCIYIYTRFCSIISNPPPALPLFALNSLDWGYYTVNIQVGFFLN